jgi:hypothetical protein
MAKRAPRSKRPRSKPRKQAPATPPAPAPASASLRLIPEDRNTLVVRMYRQGLGDCFLLAFKGTAATEPTYVLIDCGVHAREDDGPKRLAQVMEDIAAATGSHLDVVVATHEHADHLSGFVQKGSPFFGSSFTVGHLWLAWTEKRGDPQADRLRKVHGTVQRVIDKAVKEAAARTGPGAARLKASLETITDFERSDHTDADPDAAEAAIAALGKENPLIALESMPMDGGALLGVAGKAKRTKARPSSNELALGLLAAKAGGKNVTYAEPGGVLKIPGVDDLRAYVLAPPRNQDLLKKDKPSKIRGAKEGDAGGVYQEVYLSANADSRAFALSPQLRSDTGEDEPVSDDLCYPFAPAFRRKFEFGKNDAFAWKPKMAPLPENTRALIEEEYLGAGSGWRRIDSDWLGAAEQLALNLVGDTNNTSLVLAFEWGPPGSGSVLLFPGDAQVGNWLSWRDQTYTSDGKTVTADDLLARTRIYKVGHHGSHNATARRDPREPSAADRLGVPFGLELMNDIVAMIPVDYAAAKKNMPDPWKMPHEPLYRRLREKADRRVLRSDLQVKPLDLDRDGPDRVPTSTTPQDVPGLKGMRWSRSKAEFSVGTPGPLYYQVEISMKGAS